MMYLSLAYGYSGTAQVNSWKKWQEIPVFLHNFLNFFKIGNKQKQEIGVPSASKDIVAPLIIGFGVSNLNEHTCNHHKA